MEKSRNEKGTGESAVNVKEIQEAANGRFFYKIRKVISFLDKKIDIVINCL